MKRHHSILATVYTPNARRTSSHVFTATPLLHHSFPFQLPCGGISDSHTFLIPIIHLSPTHSSFSSTQAQALIACQFPQSSRSVRKIHADILDSGVYLISSLHCGLRCHPYQYNTSNMKINPPYPLTHDLPLRGHSPLWARGEGKMYRWRWTCAYPSLVHLELRGFQIFNWLIWSPATFLSTTSTGRLLIPNLRTPTSPSLSTIVCKTSCQHFSVLGSHTLVLHVQILQASNAMVRYAMYIPRQKSTQLYLCSYNTTLPPSNPVIMETCMPREIGVLLLFLSVSTFLLISICTEADTYCICPRYCIGLSANYSGQFVWCGLRTCLYQTTGFRKVFL